MYPAELVRPMAQDLTDFGFEGLQTTEAVDAALNGEGTVLCVVNSVCGCAAANARPGAKLSLGNEKTPSKVVTVFAGVDKEATARAREYMLPYPPSSPSIALFKDGEIVHFLQRLNIEGHSAENIAEELKKAYDTYC